MIYKYRFRFEIKMQCSDLVRLDEYHVSYDYVHMCIPIFLFTALVDVIKFEI